MRSMIICVLSSLANSAPRKARSISLNVLFVFSCVSFCKMTTFSRNCNVYIANLSLL